MNCPRKDVDLLTRRASGRLTAGESAALESHLAECPECRAAADEQQTVWNALEEWTAAPVSENFDTQLWARIAAEEAEPWWRRVWAQMMEGLTSKAVFAAAGACAVLLAVLLFRGPVGMPNASGVTAAQKSVDIDQVESALDDVDMLNQLGAAATPARGASGS